MAEGLGKTVGDVQDLLRENNEWSARDSPRITAEESHRGAPTEPYDPQLELPSELTLARVPFDAIFAERELVERLAHQLGFKSLEDLVLRGYDARPGNDHA
jgi:hypothetical protein